MASPAPEGGPILVRQRLKPNKRLLPKGGSTSTVGEVEVSIRQEGGLGEECTKDSPMASPTPEEGANFSEVVKDPSQKLVPMWVLPAQ